MVSYSISMVTSFGNQDLSSWPTCLGSEHAFHTTTGHAPGAAKALLPSMLLNKGRACSMTIGGAATQHAPGGAEALLTSMPLKLLTVKLHLLVVC